MNEQKSSEEIVILNVGGIKYETYRSTLLAYPKTLLGTMFNPRNQDLLKPVNGNEYFFDRNGYAFKYILEFYRTGEIRRPSTQDQQQSSEVTNKELEIELDYFQVDLDLSGEMKLKVAVETGGQELNKFLVMLDSMICYCVEKLIIESFSLTFYVNGDKPIVRYGGHPSILSCIEVELKNFQYNGYFILKGFEEEIKSYISGQKPCTLEVTHRYDVISKYVVRIGNFSKLKKAIVNHSMLKNVNQKRWT